MTPQKARPYPISCTAVTGELRGICMTRTYPRGGGEGVRQSVVHRCAAWSVGCMHKRVREGLCPHRHARRARPASSTMLPLKPCVLRWRRQQQQQRQQQPCSHAWRATLCLHEACRALPYAHEHHKPTNHHAAASKRTATAARPTTAHTTTTTTHTHSHTTPLTRRSAPIAG